MSGCACVSIKLYLPKQVVGLNSTEVGWKESWSQVTGRRPHRPVKKHEAEPRQDVRKHGHTGWNCWPVFSTDVAGRVEGEELKWEVKDNFQVSGL